MIREYWLEKYKVLIFVKPRQYQNSFQLHTVFLPACHSCLIPPTDM